MNRSLTPLTTDYMTCHREVTRCERLANDPMVICREVYHDRAKSIRNDMRNCFVFGDFELRDNARKNLNALELV